MEDEDGDEAIEDEPNRLPLGAEKVPSPEEKSTMSFSKLKSFFAPSPSPKIQSFDVFAVKKE